MKFAISLLLAKFAGANLAVKFSYVNLLNSWVVIYLSYDSNLSFNFTNFCVMVSFFD